MSPLQSFDYSPVFTIIFCIIHNSKYVRWLESKQSHTYLKCEDYQLYYVNLSHFLFLVIQEKASLFKSPGCPGTQLCRPGWH